MWLAWLRALAWMLAESVSVVPTRAGTERPAVKASSQSVDCVEPALPPTRRAFVTSTGAPPPATASAVTSVEAASVATMVCTTFEMVTAPVLMSVSAAMGSIPSRYTCEGDDASPPLRWTGVPEDTLSLVLIVDDPDAPDPAHPKVTWVHWLLYNIPPTATGLREAASPSALPAGALQGRNDWQRAGYGGPCPPVGRHRYVFRLYALDQMLLGLNDPDKAALLAAMEGHVLAETELIGTYAKAGPARR